MHCLTAWGQWAVDLLQCTASLSGAVGSASPAIHCRTARGAVGSATPAMHCLAAWGQWALQLLQCSAEYSGCGVVWCGVVWCGVVWCGVVCCAVLKALLSIGKGRNILHTGKCKTDGPCLGPPSPLPPPSETPPPPPLAPHVAMTFRVGKTEIPERHIFGGHFWYINCWVPDSPHTQTTPSSSPGPRAPLGSDARMQLNDRGWGGNIAA